MGNAEASKSPSHAGADLFSSVLESLPLCHSSARNLKRLGTLPQATLASRWRLSGLIRQADGGGKCLGPSDSAALWAEGGRFWMQIPNPNVTWWGLCSLQTLTEEKAGRLHRPLSWPLHPGQLPREQS